MSKAQLALAGGALLVLGVLAETLVLKGQAPLAMQIATGLLGALNLGGLGATLASRITTAAGTVTTGAKEGA